MCPALTLQDNSCKGYGVLEAQDLSDLTGWVEGVIELHRENTGSIPIVWDVLPKLGY